MKILFFSNYMNHHQLPFSNYISSISGIDYKFIATTETPNSRKSFGYKELNNLSIVLKEYDSKENEKQAKSMADSADVVIIGSAPDKFLNNRLKNKKLTFKYSERLYKQPVTFKNYLKRALSAYLYYGRFQKYPLYMLCASAYTSADCAKFKNFIGKTYKWGYFPENVHYDNIENLIANKQTNSILWVARFIDWKHPEIPLHMAERLKNEGFEFKIRLIGNGPLLDEIRNEIESKNLTEYIELLGSMSPEEVRGYMEQSQIFLFTSDFNEGWGAVLNEAMNSACACVASHAIGSVPFLINNSQNGLIYKNGDESDLYEKLKFVLTNDKERIKISTEAYNTIANEWNAKEAATRLLVLCEELNKKGRCDLFKSGPCSKAEIIKNDWY